MRVFLKLVPIQSILIFMQKGLSLSEFLKKKMVLTIALISLSLCPFSDLNAQGVDQNKLTIGSKADSLYAARQYSQALAAYKMAVKNIGKIDSTYYNYHLSMVNCYIRLGNLPEVENTLNKIKDGVISSDYLEVKSLFYYLSGRLEFIKMKNMQLALDNYYESYKIEMEHKFSLNRRASAGDRIGIILSDFLHQPDSSFHYLKQALRDEIELNGDFHWRVAGIHAVISHVYYGQGKLTKATSEMKTSMAILVQEVDPEIFKGIKFSKGYDSLTDFFETSIQVLKGKDVLDKIHPDDVLNNFMGIANNLILLGYLDLAEAYLRLAEAPLQKFERWNGVAGVHVSLANIYENRGQLKYALELNQTAIQYGLKAIGKFPRAETEIAWSYMNRGNLFRQLDQPDSTIYYLEKGLNLQKNFINDLNWSIDIFYLNLGSVYYDLGDNERAIDYLNKIRLEDFPHLSELSLQKAKIFKALNNLDSALFYHKKSISSVLNSNDVNHGSYLANLGTFLYESQQSDSALFYFQKSLIVNTLDNSVPPLEYDYDTRSSQVLHPIPFLNSLIQITNFSNREFERTQDKKHLTRAIQAINLSKRLINTIQRSFIQEVDLVESYSITRKMIEVSLETTLLHASHGDEQTAYGQAFEMIDLAKSQIILEAVRNRNIDNSAVNQTLKRIGRLKTQIDLQKSKVINARLRTSQSEPTAEISILKDYEDALAELLLELKTAQPKLHDYVMQDEQVFSVQELSTYLEKNDEAIIEFFWSHEKLFILTHVNGTTRMRKVNTDLTKLSTEIKRINEFVKNKPTANEATLQQFKSDAHSVYQEILSPTLQDLQLSKLLIIPDGPLQNLPFEVLLSEKVNSGQNAFKNLPYLLKTYEINYASSAALLLEDIRTGNQRKTSDYMAWAPFSDAKGNTVQDSEVLRDENLTNLPGASKELEVLGTVFSGTSFFSDEANEESFKQNIDNARIVHIATHGIINDQDPNYSNLIFGETPKSDSVEDNRLYMFELYALRLNTELAVLTACNTGAGKQEQGEGTISLARAFKYAGAKSVLMSLWLANDQSTSDIVGDFYRNLADKQGKGEALRNAKLQYLKQADNLGSHPFYWSHLILSGDSSPLSSQGIKQEFLWLTGLLILGVILLRSRKRATAR